MADATTSPAAPTAASPGSDLVYRSCPLCEAKCGLAVERDRAANHVLSVRGDPDNPLSRGYICPKSHGLIGLHEDPDRLRRPQQRVGDDWREISWEDAYDLVGSRLAEIRERHGADALATYAGNPSVHDVGATIFNGALIRGLGSRRRFSASTVDQLPKMLSSRAMFGGSLTIPVPDVDRTDYLMVLGANPLASNGSLMTAPDMPGRLRALRERGGRLVVVDPRRSETARVADEHLFITPGSDAFFLFALVNVLFEEELVALGRLESFVRGVEEVRTLAKDFAPEAVAPRTGIDGPSVRRLARELARAQSAAIYGRIGTCTQEFGTLASWLVDVLNTLTGNLDRVGGVLFPRAATGRAVDRPRKSGPIEHGRWHSSVSNHPEVLGELPAAALAEEIDAAEEPIRGLVTVCGNPVLSTPNGARLTRALAGLEFMVSVDIYRNETTHLADVILPPTSQLESSNYDLAWGSFSVRNVVQYTPQVLEPPEDSQPQWRILAEIVGRTNGIDADAVDEMVFSHLLSSAAGSPNSSCPEVSQEEARRKLGDVRGPERIVDMMLRAGPFGDGFDDAADGLSLATVRQSEHGIDLGPMESRLPDLLGTDSGAVELAPELIVSDVPRLRARLEESAEGMVLIGRRQMRTNNSWMHNVPALAKGRDRCTLLVNPDDAKRLGLADGKRARVTSRVGEVEAPVVVTGEMMPGVVSLPHGFGHDVPGSNLSVASRQQPGVNTNLLTDETNLDVLSGNCVLNGIPVRVDRA